MNAKAPIHSVFDLCLGKSNDYLLKPKREIRLRIEQPLFSVQFGVLGKE